MLVFTCVHVSVNMYKLEELRVTVIWYLICLIKRETNSFFVFYPFHVPCVNRTYTVFLKDQQMNLDVCK